MNASAPDVNGLVNINSIKENDKMKTLDEIKQLKAYGSAAGLKPETPSHRKKCHGLRMALISAGVSLAGGFYFAEKNSANASEPSAVLEDRSGTAAVQSQPVENHGRQGKAETHSGPGRDTGGSENKEPVAVKGSWKTSDMPEKHETFFISRTISPEQMEILRRGHVPKEMEDKWFWYMEGDTLFAHRAWTGYCIFRIDFSTAGDHRVTVNRDIRQYRCTSIKEDKKTLNDLLDWWTRSPYDYYGEWLSETASAIESEKRQNGSQVEKEQKGGRPGADRSGARRVRGVGGLVPEDPLVLAEALRIEAKIKAEKNRDKVAASSIKSQSMDGNNSKDRSIIANIIGCLIAITIILMFLVWALVYESKKKPSKPTCAENKDNKITKEKLGKLLHGFMGPQVKWHDSHGWYAQIKLPVAGFKGMKVVNREQKGDRVVFTLNQEGADATTTLIVNFVLSDKDNGRHQQLEVVGFTPWEPNQLKVKDGQFMQAVKLCSNVSTHIVPHVNLTVGEETGWFFAKRGIEDPGTLPEEWLVNHWLKPSFGAIVTAFARIAMMHGSAA